MCRSEVYMFFLIFLKFENLNPFYSLSDSPLIILNNLLYIHWFFNEFFHALFFFIWNSCMKFYKEHFYFYHFFQTTCNFRGIRKKFASFEYFYPKNCLSKNKYLQLGGDPFYFSIFFLRKSLVITLTPFYILLYILIRSLYILVLKNKS